jgi:hypothetical protein
MSDLNESYYGTGSSNEGTLNKGYVNLSVASSHKLTVEELISASLCSISVAGMRKRSRYFGQPVQHVDN